MDTKSGDLRAERARFIDEINRRRVALGKRPLRRHVLPIDVVATGVTKLSWFADVVVEMPRRPRWYVVHPEGVKEAETVHLDVNGVAAKRMLKRLGGDWVADPHFNAKVECDVLHFELGNAMCVPWWLPLLRKASPTSQRAAAIRLALTAPESWPQVETTLRLASSPSGVRCLITSLLGQAE